MRAYDDSPLVDKMQAKMQAKTTAPPSPLQVLADKMRAHGGRANAKEPSAPTDVCHGQCK